MGNAEEFLTMSKERVTIKDVIILHIKKISDLTIREFTPSFWTKKPVKVGEGVAIIETYHQDSREAYCNAVDFLLDLLMSYADQPFLDRFKKLKADEEEQYKKFNQEKKSQDEWVWVKLKLRRKLFGQLILLIDRVRLYTPTLSMSDSDISAMLEEEEEKEGVKEEISEAV